YTDLTAAKRAAVESGKPILSLRLLGTLDSEFSCANSRFFRTVLYANAEVSKVLSERFVLHWKSVRPVPKVTIDFGDGRVVERTITGNSIHYVLNTDGNVIDGIPGLYGPGAFREQLDGALATKRRLDQTPTSERVAILATWHRDAGAKLLQAWDNDLTQLGVRASGASKGASIVLPPGTAGTLIDAPAVVQAPPTAVQAAPRAAGKLRAEGPLVS